MGWVGQSLGTGPADLWAFTRHTREQAPLSHGWERGVGRPLGRVRAYPGGRGTACDVGAAGDASDPSATSASGITTAGGGRTGGVYR